MLKICGRCYRKNCRGTIVQEDARERRCILCGRTPPDRLDAERPMPRERGPAGRLRREPRHYGSRELRGAA